jgi:Sodium/hydrogen exchanger family
VESKPQTVQLRYIEMMDTVLTHTVSFLGVAILVAIIARRMRLPYTVGLVLTGIGLAVAEFETGAMLTHDFIFEVVLPPLLFEAALSIRWRELRQDMLPVVVLSALGVVIAAVVVATGMVKVLAWPAVPALVFGVLIAATDPIAVLAMFKDTGIKGRLQRPRRRQTPGFPNAITALTAMTYSQKEVSSTARFSTSAAPTRSAVPEQRFARTRLNPAIPRFSATWNTLVRRHIESIVHGGW